MAKKKPNKQHAIVAKQRMQKVMPRHVKNQALDGAWELAKNMMSLHGRTSVTTHELPRNKNRRVGFRQLDDGRYVMPVTVKYWPDLEDHWGARQKGRVRVIATPKGWRVVTRDLKKAGLPKGLSPGKGSNRSPKDKPTGDPFWDLFVPALNNQYS